MTFSCAKCGFTLPYRPTHYLCLCGREHLPSGAALDHSNTVCQYLGSQVDSIPAKLCGCGTMIDVPVYHCAKYDCRTTEHVIPRRKQRQDRNCTECRFSDEHT